MHSEDAQPGSPYERCDVLIESNQRNPADCEPLCPYQRVTPWVQEVWELWCMIEESWEEKDKPLRYGISVERLSFALQAFLIPRAEWRSAWRWLALIAHSLSHPEFKP